MTRVVGWTLRIGVGLGFLGLLVGGTLALHLRSAAPTAEAALAEEPLPVAAIALVQSESYSVADRFVGRVEPARSAHLAFERAGLLLEVAVEEGQRVEEGQLIARLDTALLEAEVARLEAQRGRALADLELARLTEGRQRTLRQQGHASEQRLDETRLARAALEGELAALDAAIRGVEIDLDKSLVLAPFAGTVAARAADPGTVVATGSPLVELLETDRPQARIGVTPEAARGLSLGQTVRIEAGGIPMEGRIAAIRPDISTQTRTVGVLVDLPPGQGVSFGDIAALEMAQEISASGIWLPLSALVEGERGLWTVLTLTPDEDGTYAVGREAVELLHTDGRRAFVRGTLAAGQMAIAEGRIRVVPGQRVVPAD